MVAQTQKLKIMTTLIGYNIILLANKQYISMYFRDFRGFKYKISGYIENMTGAKDMCICSNVKEMTTEEYNALPEKE